MLVLVLARVYLALRRPAPCAVAQAVPRVKTIRIWSSSASSLEQSLCVHAQGAAWVAQQGPRFPNTGWGVVSNFGLSLRLVFSRIQPKARRFRRICAARVGNTYGSVFPSRVSDGFVELSCSRATACLWTQVGAGSATIARRAITGRGRALCSIAPGALASLTVYKVTANSHVNRSL